MKYFCVPCDLLFLCDEPNPVCPKCAAKVPAKVCARCNKEMEEDEEHVANEYRGGCWIILGLNEVVEKALWTHPTNVPRYDLIKDRE
jgi:DNA-directed RNA polymerase subunit RPC12/RpoP